jgi:hypothetical protein
LASELAHIAATVGQIVAIFHKDLGLMVELEEPEIAEDAIDHRQRMSDSELTDEVIFAGSCQKAGVSP